MVVCILWLAVRLLPAFRVGPSFAAFSNHAIWLNPSRRSATSVVKQAFQSVHRLNSSRWMWEATSSASHLLVPLLHGRPMGSRTVSMLTCSPERIESFGNCKSGFVAAYLLLLLLTHLASFHAAHLMSLAEVVFLRNHFPKPALSCGNHDTFSSSAGLIDRSLASRRSKV
ncbi:expressed unknown protein [Seminavis robusta]|uniref:Secreted protein n=1 Tax=Seminavis robusta TaxID=568900 RepID=A0A9N8DQB6_9STRA|nr:expressed unknown protein [Seminavis robusta]|eukprot:Sro296_g110611.1  (170) ;mRNA; r:15367-15876